jgi:Lrp/AsnC family leucine-responsive transcriptional regulator
MNRIGAFDLKDLQIIEALQLNARAPLAELGRQIGLSQPSMSERVKRLEERMESSRVMRRASTIAPSALV